MGYFLLYEGMLDSVIAARDKYLSPGGLILPNDCFMHLFAISDEDRYAKTIEFWQMPHSYRILLNIKTIHDAHSCHDAQARLGHRRYPE